MGRWIWVMVLCSCAPAVTLRTLPEQSAPLEQRTLAWDALRPAKHTEGELELRNGLIITEPSSLQPVLEPGTRADVMLHAWHRSRAHFFAVGIVAVLNVLTSATLIGVGLDTSIRPRPPAAVGLIGFANAGAALVHLIAGAILSGVSAYQRERVFDAYEISLRARLAIPSDPPVVPAPPQPTDVPWYPL